MRRTSAVEVSFSSSHDNDTKNASTAQKATQSFSKSKIVRMPMMSAPPTRRTMKKVMPWVEHKWVLAMGLTGRWTKRF